LPWQWTEVRAPNNILIADFSRPSYAIVEMTPDQLRVFSKFITDGSRNVKNASCVLEQPSCEQSKSMEDALKELVERIEQIR
jgi:hypothetical protein